MKKAIIFDLGSSTWKVGFAGGDHPILVFPSCVGRPKSSSINVFEPVNKESSNVKIGEDALGHNLQVSYPLKDGKIENREEVKELFAYAFRELNVKPEERTIVISIAIENQGSLNEQLTEILFKDFNVDGIYINYQTFFTLVRSNLTTGIVVEIGDSFTQIVPTIHSYSLSKKCQIQCAGSSVDKWLQNNLNFEGLEGDSHINHYREMKEKMCYVSLDYNQERNKFQSESRKINIKGFDFELREEIIAAPENIFFPILPEKIVEAIDLEREFPIEDVSIIQAKLYHNIILSGGSSQFKNFPERLKQELIKLRPNFKKDVRIIALKNPIESAWRGASMFAAPYLFNQFVVTRKEYDKAGPGIIERKFI